MARDLFAKGTFLHFHYAAFQAELEGVRIPGMSEPISWDRKAAYLLWCARGNDPALVGLPQLPVPKKSSTTQGDLF